MKTRRMNDQGLGRLRERLDLLDVLEEEQARRGQPAPLPTMDESELRAYWREVATIWAHPKERPQAGHVEE